MKTWLIYLASILAVFGLSLQFGFFQDDYFHLLISRADSMIDVVQFFVPDPSRWVFFRPISTQFYYYIFTSLFGLVLAPIAMHVFMLVLHTTNAYLVQRVTSKIKGVSKTTSSLIGLLYGVSGVHFMSLFYIGATQELLAMFFTLLAIIFLSRNRLVPHILMVILALLSKELSIRIPVFIFFYLLLTGSSLKQSLKRTLPSIMLVITYLALRMAWGITTPSEYAFDFSPLTTIATTMWYALMSLGLPEHILNYGLSGGMVDFLRFLHSTGVVGWFSLVSFFGITSLSIFSVIRLTKINITRLISLLGIWVSSILLVIFLPTHRYAHYLDLSIIAVFTLLFSNTKKRLRYFLLILIVTASVSSVYIDYHTHWTIMRARIAHNITTRIQTDNACDYSTWYLTGSERVLQEVEYATLWDNYLPIICSDSVELVYNEPSGEYYLLELSERDLLPR